MVSFAIMFFITLLNHCGVITILEGYLHLSLPGYRKLIFWIVLVFNIMMTKKAIYSIVITSLLVYLSLWIDLSFHIADYYYRKMKRSFSERT